MFGEGEKGILPSWEPRWRHLYFMSEDIAESAVQSGDIWCLLRGLKYALTSLNEVFPRELDPASDPEGFAMRRFVKSLLGTLDKMEEKIGKG